MPNRESDYRAEPLPRKSEARIMLLLLGLIGGGVLVWLVTLILLNPTPEQWDQRIKEQAAERWKAEERQATSDQYRARAFLEYWLLLLE